MLLGVEPAPAVIEQARDAAPRSPFELGSPSETVVPVISSSPSFLLNENEESIVADGSRPSASQRSGWLLTFE